MKAIIGSAVRLYMHTRKFKNFICFAAIELVLYIIIILSLPYTGRGIDKVNYYSFKQCPL